MISSDMTTREAVEAFVPDMPESYTKMVADTVSALKAGSAHHSDRKAKTWKAFAAAAAVIAAAILSSAVVFGARPALAAQIPFVNGIVYSASPRRSTNEDERKQIGALLDDAFNSFAACQYHAASRCFKEGCLNSRENYLAAAYLNYMLSFGDVLPSGASAGELEISDLQAESRAFRSTAGVTLDLVSRDGAKTSKEECTVRIWENTKGLYIESIEFGSAGYGAFVQTYEAAFGAVPAEGMSFDVIPIDTAYLIITDPIIFREGARQRAGRLNHLLSELDLVSASSGEKSVRTDLIRAELDKAEAEITPDVVSVEQTASTLMYLYWLGAKTGEAADFSGIIELNEATDLFCWDALLKAEQVKLGVLQPLVKVEERSAEILEILENTDGIIKARVYVHTEISDGISQGVGEEIVLTLRKDAGGLTVIGFDREVGDGLYTYSLKPIAMKYRAAGYSWQDADRMAYEELHEQIERDAEWLAGH